MEDLPHFLEEEEEEELTEELAGELLVEHLVNLKVVCRLTAKDCCVLAWWAAQAGANCELLKKLAWRPGDSTGNYSKHFDDVLGQKKENPTHLKVEVPLYNPSLGERVLQDVPCLAPHEALVEEVEDLQETWVPQLEHTVQEFPAAYHEHLVVVRSRPHLAAPVALYLDGIQYATRDTVLGIFLVNMVTQTRHLLCAPKKKHLCRCGCLGWCTLWPIFRFLHWSLRALSLGLYPAQGPEGVDFKEYDQTRADKAGQDLGLVGALLYLKADLAEYGHTLGFLSTSSKEHPCFLCWCHHGSLVKLEGWDVLSAPWPAKSMDDLHQACQHCEVWVTMARAHRRAILPFLEEDRRQSKGASRGLALTTAYPPLGLEKGDRLEPCWERPNTHSFLKDVNFPPQQRVLFWRAS